MAKRMLLLFALTMLALSLGGCVMKSDYDGKVQEVEQLNQSLEETQGDYNRLKSQFDTLEATSSSQQARVTTLENDLNNVRQELIEVTKPENLLKTLAETLSALQRQVEMLAAENAGLKAGAPPAEMPAEEPAADAEAALSEAAPTIKPSAEATVPAAEPAPEPAPEPTPAAPDEDAPAGAPPEAAIPAG